MTVKFQNESTDGVAGTAARVGHAKNSYDGRRQMASASETSQRPRRYVRVMRRATQRSQCCVSAPADAAETSPALAAAADDAAEEAPGGCGDSAGCSTAAI